MQSDPRELTIVPGPEVISLTEPMGTHIHMETTTNAMAKNDVTTDYITCRMLSAT